MTNEVRCCSKCNKEKPITDFYKHRHTVRPECKKCTIAQNVRYQVKNEVWKVRYREKDETREYMKEYYQKHKAKYAEATKRFRKLHPEYHKEYARNKKQKEI